MSTQQPQYVNQSKIVRWAIIGFLILLLFFVLTNTTFLTIEPGHVGVKFKRFDGGLKKEKIFEQGFHVVAPWDRMIVYATRYNENVEKMEVLSKNGLNIVVELSFRYRPIDTQIGYLHDNVGEDFLSRIIIPEIRSATREVIGKYLPEELYSTKREAIQDEIFTRTAEALTKKHIALDAILIRQVKLPTTLEQAIERKLKQEQENLEYDFKLLKERKEAERKIIEAEAKAKSNEILSASLTDRILQDKGIDATIELSTSPNSKVIIVGSGDSGLPLILGNN